jgi:dienelactone hydrolase
MQAVLSALFGFFVLISSSGAIRADAAIEQKITFPGIDQNILTGTLYQPELSDGFLPAVVLQHDCFGITDSQRRLARHLAELGYFSLLVDSFAGKNKSDTCQTALAPDISDAVSAGKFLGNMQGIDKDRIGLIAWAMPVTAAIPAPFTAAVLFYPACPANASPSSAMPLLILTGADDNWTPAETCVKYIQRQTGKSARIRTYPGTGHSFDNTQLGQPRSLTNTWRPKDGKVGRVDIAYNRLAHEDAKKRVEDFLNRHLQLTLAKAYPSKAYSPLPLHADTDDTPAINNGRGTWVIDPATTGPNAPPAGRSVFDRLFSKLKNGKAVYDVPFPYTALIKHLNARLQPGKSGGEPIKQVLFPMGRSLQREASAPDYFSSPRIVVAIDGEPVPEASMEPILLKDRLFLGYVERTNVLEVISYNETASRFEFQVVKNYAQGKTPEVYYADRRLCTSCHQNKSPLFPRENWTETNAAGGKVGQRLRDIGKTFHGITVRRSGEVPAKIDLSTDRANLFSVLQKLWREGCGKENRLEARQCRAAAYKAMVQFRLTNTQDFDRNAKGFRNQFQTVITRNWRDFWPGGLFIPNSDIPDRDPLGKHSAITGSRDPLTKRGPMEVWSGFRRSDPERLITGFADQFIVSDIEKLDGFLISQSDRFPPQVLTTSCDVSFNPRRGLDHPLTLICLDDAGALSLKAEIALPGRTPSKGTLKLLEVGGFALGDQVNLKAGDLGNNTFNLFRKELSARLPNGKRVSSLTFTPLKSGGEPIKRFTKATRAAEVRLEIVDDFALIEKAITKLAKQNAWLFADAPFHGPKSMSVLFSALGLPTTQWCCDADRPAPPIRIDTIRPMETASVRIHARSLRLMVKTCGACHRTGNAHPPNFLTGSAAQALGGIRACAPRILRRLALWDIPASQRDQTAMPPINVLHARGLTAQVWRQSADLRRIREFVGMLAKETAVGETDTRHLSCAEN